jgi:hypothetical protein
VHVLERRFGSYLKAIKRFADEDEKKRIPSTDELIVSPGAFVKPQKISKKTSPVYGPLINFRGLQHAPLRELGVVFVFGMLVLFQKSRLVL